MLRPVRSMCLLLPSPNSTSLGTKTSCEMASMMGCRALLRLTVPASGTSLGRVQLFECATRARLKRQSAVASETIVCRKSS